MSENQNQSEKIVYDIEVRVKSAQEQLNNLKNEFNSVAKQLGQKLKFETDFKITGMEDFRTLQQRLSEVRRALQYVSEYKNKLANISLGSTVIDGKSLQATEKELRALEKSLEDMQTKINAGNFNKQLKEQEKLQKSVDTTIRKINELQKMVANSFLTDKALSQTRLSSVIDKTQKYVNDLNGLYKQLGVNARAVNPFKDYAKNYDEYFAKTNEKRQQELKAEQKHAKELSNLRAKQNRQSNDTEFKDSQTARQNATNKLKEDIVERSKLTAIEIKEQQKLQQEYDKTVKAIDKLSNAFNRSFNNKTAWSMDKFANQFDKGEELVQKANDLSSKLGLNKTFENPMRTVFDYTDYRKQTKQALDEDELRAVKQLEIDEKRRNTQLKAEEEYTKKLSDLRAKQNRQANDSEFKDSQTARQNATNKLKEDILQREQLAQINRSANESYWLNLEKQMTANAQAHKQAWEQITKVEQQYMNLLDQANLKKQLGIQLSEKEYEGVQRQLKNAKERYRYEGGNPSTLPKLDTRKQFNSEAQDNFIKSMNSRMVEAMSLSTSYSEQMSKLSKILDTATYAWNKSGRTAQEYRNIMLQAKSAIDETAKSLNKLHQQTGATMGLMDKMAMGLRTHMTWILSSAAASVPLVLPGYAIGTMKNLESQFATVEQVMPEIEEAHMQSVDKNLTETQRMEGLKKVNDEMNTFINIGSKFGVAVEDVIKAGASIGRMYGQGENGVANTNLLTQQAARIAVADNFPIMQAAKGLESALSQFGLQTEDTNQLMINSNRIIDVWTTAAHKGAASAQDLTEGVQLAGAAAHQAGVSFEFLNSLISTGVRATGRSGNEIGNSIKSFLNSMQSDKSILALKSFGIDVFKDNSDGTKSLRSMEDVILDISRMMQTTNKDTSSLLLTLAGGKYQVSKLTAILKDYKELVRMTAVLNSKDVVGFTDKQIEIQLNTLSRKLEGLHANIQGLFMDIGNNGGLDALKSIVEYINNIVTGVRELDSSWATWTKDIILAIAALKGIPFLLNNIPKTLGGIYQRGKNNWDNYSGVNIFSNAKNTISNSWNEGVTSNTGIVSNKQSETESIDDNTRALRENEQAKNTNANSSSVLVTASQNEANSQSKVKNTIENTNQAMSNASKVAKEMGLSGQVVVTTTQNIGSASKKASVGVGILTTVMRGASAVMGAFGGPVGLAITALSIAIPLILDYTQSVGESANTNKKLIDSIDEKIDIQEQEYNRLVRASDTAEELANQYNILNDSLNKNTNDTDQNNKIQGMMADTKEAIISLIGEENVAVDENGNIKIDTIKDVAKVAYQAYQDEVKQRIQMVNDATWEAGEKVRLAKEKIKAMKEEGKGIGLLSKAYAAYAKMREWVQKAQTLSLTSRAMILKAEGDDAGYSTFMQQADKSKEAEGYWNKQSSVEETSEYRDAINGLKEAEDNLNKSELTLSESKLKYADSLLNNKYDTGGADSDRGNYIAEPPEEKKKKDKKSKAEKEAEKLAKQQENFNKVQNRIGLISEETALNYSLRKNSFNNIGLGNITNSGDKYVDAANLAASMIGRPDLAKYIYSQWALESGRFTDNGALSNNNFAGLMKPGTQTLQSFDDVMQFAKEYVKQTIGLYDFSGVSNGMDFANLLYKNGYFTADPTEYGNNVESIANESASKFSKTLTTALSNKYYDIAKEVQDTSLTALTEQKLNLLAKDFFDKYGYNLYVTSMKRNGSGGSWHDSGQAIDVADDLLENDINARNWLIAQGQKYGLTPLDEYAFPSPNATGGHVHFSDHGTPLSFANGASSGYQTSLSSTSLATPAGFVYNMLKSYGVDMEKLNALSSATTTSKMIDLTDRSGMNIRYDQRIPIAGDILYDKNGEAYVVRNNGGYISSTGKKGNNWKDISDLTDTYTSAQYAIGLTLENAASKLGSLKLSEEAENLANTRIDRDKNYQERAFENFDKEDKRYEYEQNLIANRRAIYGKYDSQAYTDEYINAKRNLDNKRLNYVYLQEVKKQSEQQLNDLFGNGILKEIIDKSGYDNWKELSDGQISNIVEKFSKTINDSKLKDIYEQWKSVNDAVDEADEKLKQVELDYDRLNGLKNPEEILQTGLENVSLNSNFWKSTYSTEYGGFEWQNNKREYDDAIKQIKLYTDSLAYLDKQYQDLKTSKNYSKKDLEDITKAIIEQRTKLNEAVKQAQKTSDQLTESSKQTISDMLHDLIKGGSSFKDIWRNLWDDVAKIALDRLMQIKDTTNGPWNLISNIFGFGKKNTDTVASIGKGTDYVDNYNINNSTLGTLASKLPSTSSTVGYKYSNEGVADFYSKGSALFDDNQLNQFQQVADTNLQAFEIGREASTINQAVSGVEQAISATDQANTAMDQTSATATTTASSEMLIASGNMLSAASLISANSSLGAFSSLGFAHGGKIPKFASGGRTIVNGGKIKGAGTGTSDSILAYLHDRNRLIGVSNGEYIMNANATRKYEGILQMMNMDKFADGGSISSKPIPYVPTLRNPNVVNKIIQQDSSNVNQNATMEKLLGQQNGILQGMADNKGDNGSGQVVVLNTKASKEEIFSALASDPRALQKLLGNNKSRGFR